MRTPTQIYSTPSDVEKAPRKGKTTLTLKPKGPIPCEENAETTPQESRNMTSSKISKADNIEPTPENLLAALEKAQNIFRQKVIRNDQKEDAHQSLEWIIIHFKEMSRKLKDMQKELGKQQPDENPDRLDTIEAKIDKILKKVEEPPKTYAEAAHRAADRPTTPIRNRSTRAQTPSLPPSSPAINRTQEIQQRNLQRKVQQRREQNKLEVVLTTQEMEADMKEHIRQQSHAEITAKLQQNVESQMKDNFPIIRGVVKLKSQDIRIHCKTEEEAKQLRGLKWNTAYDGLTVHQPKYGLMIPGIPTDLIDPNDLKNPEFARQLEHQNKENGIQIVGMKPLRRKHKNNAQYFSLVAFLTNPEAADQCIKHGFYINHQRFYPEKYAPQFQLIQCYKCQKYGHHATSCRSLHEICAKCGEHHPTSQCHSETHKCAGCKGEHPAWHHDCPNRINAIQNLTTRKREAPSYFNE